MKWYIHKCNTIESVKKALHEGYNHIEVDVSLSTTGRLNITHDMENINNPQNCSIQEILNVSKNCAVMIDIKARGIDKGVEMARKLIDAIHGYDNELLLCSFNEYCVNECIELREQFNLKYKVGVISSGLPLGMFKHLSIDFISLEYSFLFDDIREYLDKNIEIYSFTVNSKQAQDLCHDLDIDGIILDIDSVSEQL